MNNDFSLPKSSNIISQNIAKFVEDIFQNKQINDNIIDENSKNLVQEVHEKTNQKDKPKSWWQSVKSAFNRGKTEGKGGIKGFFKGCWEATKTGWRNTNKYVKTAIGAGCLLAGSLLMPLLSVTSSGTSAISATLQLASKFSAPALSLATGVCSLISGGVDVGRDIVNYVSPNKCFNVAQSKWNDIIEYARYEHKQKCISQQASDINSKSFIISELNAVMNTIKTEYKYFYNSNYPDGQDEDLQVVLNEYLKSLKERASKSPDNFKLYRADVYPELSTENNIQKNNIDI